MRGKRLYHRELMTWARFDMGGVEMAVVGCLIEEYFIILFLDASLSEHLSKPCYIHASTIRSVISTTLNQIEWTL